MRFTSLYIVGVPLLVAWTLNGFAQPNKEPGKKQRLKKARGRYNKDRRYAYARQRASKKRYISAQAYYHAMRSEIAMSEGKLKKASEELQLALVYDAESLYLITTLAGVSLQLNRKTRARRMVNWAMRLAPKRPEVLLLKARVELLEGQPGAAERTLKNVIRLDKESIEAPLLLAEILEKRSRHQAASRVLSVAAKRNPSSVEPLEALAMLEARRKRYLKEADALERAVARRPNSVRLLLSLTTAYERLLQRDKAVNRWRAFIKNNPANAKGLFQAARMELSVGNTKEGERLIGLIQGQTQSIETDYSIAQLLMSEGLYKKAAQALEEVLAQKSAHQGARFNLGLARYHLGDDQKALSELEQIGSTSGDFVPARLRIANILMGLKRYRRAELALRAALEKKPGSDKLMGRLALIMERRSGSTAGLKTLRELSKKRSDKSLGLAAVEAGILQRAGQTEAAFSLLDSLKGKVDESDRLHEVASLHEAASQDAKVVEVLKRLLKRSPDSALALNYLGFFYAQKNERLKEAEQMLERAAALRPHSAAILDSLGWALRAQGRLKEAEALIARAARLLPRDPEIAEHLGDIFRLRGRTQDARVRYQRALKSLRRAVNALKKGREGDLERVKQKLGSLDQK